MKIDYKLMFAELDRLIELGDYNRFYSKLPLNTKDDLIKKYGIIAQSEFNYSYHIYIKDGLHERLLPENATLENCVKALEEFWNLYNSIRPNGYTGIKIFEFGVKLRLERLNKQVSTRYTKLKNRFKTVFTNQVCFKCESTEEI